jgi:hypothetical protein
VYDKTSGNVGIGTATPVGLLDVDRKLTVLSGGNVGIGSATPLSKLDVTGGAARILMGGVAPNVGYATTPGSLYVQDNLEVDGNVYLGDAVTDNLTVTGILSLTGGANYFGPITISTTHAGAFIVREQNSGTQIFNVDTVAGNVGVGTSAPAAKLQVGAGTPNSMSGTGGDLFVKGNIELDGMLYGDGGGLTNLIGSGWTTGTGKVYTTISTDNVGIGSTAPERPLDVIGHIRASGNVGIGAALVDNANVPRLTITPTAIEINLQ